MRQGTPNIDALSRALDLLQIVAADGGGNNVSRLAEASGIPPASAHRIVRTLEKSGFLLAVGRGRYGAGPALAMLGEHAQRPGLWAAVARSQLAVLAGRAGAVAHLGVFENDMVTYLVKTGGNDTALFTREQLQLEAYCSGVGKVLLANLPDRERERYLAGGPFVRLTDRTRTEPDDIRRELETVLAQGFAVDDGEISPDLHCLAVPIIQDGARVEAAISISMLGASKDRPSQDVLLRLLRKTSQSIALGMKSVGDCAP